MTSTGSERMTTADWMREYRVAFAASNLTAPPVGRNNTYVLGGVTRKLPRTQLGIRRLYDAIRVQYPNSSFFQTSTIRDLASELATANPRLATTNPADPRFAQQPPPASPALPASARTATARTMVDAGYQQEFQQEIRASRVAARRVRQTAQATHAAGRQERRRARAEVERTQVESNFTAVFTEHGMQVPQLTSGGRYKFGGRYYKVPKTARGITLLRARVASARAAQGGQGVQGFLGELRELDMAGLRGRLIDELVVLYSEQASTTALSSVNLHMHMSRDGANQLLRQFDDGIGAHSQEFSDEWRFDLFAGLSAALLKGMLQTVLASQTQPKRYRVLFKLQMLCLMHEERAAPNGHDDILDMIGVGDTRAESGMHSLFWVTVGGFHPMQAFVSDTSTPPEELQLMASGFIDEFIDSAGLVNKCSELLAGIASNYNTRALIIPTACHVKLMHEAFGAGAKDPIKLPITSSNIINVLNDDYKCFWLAAAVHWLHKEGIERLQRPQVVHQNKDKVPLVVPKRGGVSYKEWPYPNGVALSEIDEWEEVNPSVAFAVIGLEQAEEQGEERDLADGRYKDKDGRGWNLVPIRLFGVEQYKKAKDLIVLVHYNNHYAYSKDLSLFQNSDKKIDHCPCCLKRFYGPARAVLQAHIENECNGDMSTTSTGEIADKWSICETPRERYTRFKTELDNSTETGKERWKKEKHVQQLERKCSIKTTNQDAVRFAVDHPTVAYFDFEGSYAVEDGSGVRVCTPRSYRIHFRGAYTAEVSHMAPVGDDTGAAEHFVSTLMEHYTEIVKVHTRYEDIADAKRDGTITSEDKTAFAAAQLCYLCGVECSGENKCMDHCHLTGRYLGAACKDCNFARRVPTTVPVIAHNSNFDINMIWQALAPMHVNLKAKGFELSMLPSNTEKCKTFGIGNFKVMDSFAFMASSLDKLITDLPHESRHAIRNVCKSWAKKHKLDADAVYEVASEKGVFPYEYDWPAHLDEPIPLEDEDKLKTVFANKLGAGFSVAGSDQKEVLAGIHDSSKTVTKLRALASSAGANTYHDLHDLYLAIDVAGLEDVMTEFRGFFRYHHNIDCLHFLGLPGLGNHIAFTMATYGPDAIASEGIDLAPTTEMYRFLREAVHGGISMARQPHAKANRPDLKGYDPKKPFKAIEYVDCNSLYPTVCVNKLPVGNYKWIDPEEFDPEDNKWGGLPNHPTQPCEEWQGDYGGVIEADWHYPEHLHDLHNDYPLGSEHIKVSHDWISTSQRSQLPKNTTTKLTPTLCDKSRHRCTVTMAKFMIKHGLILKKVHRVLEYKQVAYLKPYMDLMRARRATAPNKFQQDLNKLLMNCVYGKLNESPFGRMSARFTNRKTILQNRVVSGRVRDIVDISPTLACMYLNPEVILLNKPVAAGQAVLDMSKMVMAQFWYEVILPNHGGCEKVKLHMTDTDSLMYSVESRSLEEYEADKNKYAPQWLDRSGYPEGHPLRDCSHAKAFGFFKEENGVDIITECVALRAKCYSFRQVGENDEEKVTSKLKGVPKCITKMLKPELYVNTLAGERYDAHFYALQARSHTNAMRPMSRVMLRPGDDKGFVSASGRVLAHGHRDTPSFGETVQKDYSY